MGTNYYVDLGEEGNDYGNNYHHIGKTSFLSKGMTFIFFKTRQYQISHIQSMNDILNSLDEYGERMTVKEFLDYIIDLPYKEEDLDFF